MKLLYMYIVSICFISIGCSAVKETSSHQMETGIYKVLNQKNKPFYALVEEDKITLHPVEKTKQGWIANTDTASAIHLLAANFGRN